MKLQGLIKRNWKNWEQKRFVNDSTKSKTEDFDPEAFKHDGFDNREKYLETYIPALADEERLSKELNNFAPPRLDDINDSPYQALVIRYGILQTLIQQPDYEMEKQELLKTVQSWQQNLLESYSDSGFSDDSLLHLATAAVEYQNDIDDSELNLIARFCDIRNQNRQWKHECYFWVDIFERLASIERFPKVSRSEQPAHALGTIQKGLWSLQDQAIVYEVKDADVGDLVGIPEDYGDYVRSWLPYEMSDENFLTMLETLAAFDKQSNLVEAAKKFGIDKKNHGLNEKRRENIVEAGVFPSDLLRGVLSKRELKQIVSQYGLDAHKRKTDEMIEKIIEYFEQQKSISKGEPEVNLYLEYFEDLGDGKVEQAPPQLYDVVDEADLDTKLEVLFEKATAEIFQEIFNIGGTTLLGQTASGIVADGEIEQDGKWLLWDNKRRVNEFKLGADTQSKIKNYIHTKSQQHDVEWFLVIAPAFSPTAEKNAKKLEKQLGVEIRLITSSDFKHLATFWKENLDSDGRRLPLSTFYGSGVFDYETSTEILHDQFV